MKNKTPDKFLETTHRILINPLAGLALQKPTGDGATMRMQCNVLDKSGEVVRHQFDIVIAEKYPIARGGLDTLVALPTNGGR